MLVVASRTAPDTLHPLLAGDEASQRVVQLVFNPLFDFTDDLRLRPALAERLEVPDPLTYVVHLRERVKFHDGTDLTADDVAYTFSLILDPTLGSPFRGAFRVLAEVKVIGRYRVAFHLREPFSAFPNQLAGVPPVVKAGSAGSLRTRPVGTGPYRFLRYTADDEVVLERFDQYWDGPARNTGVVLKVVPDDTMRGLELRNRSLDLAVNSLPPDIVHELEHRSRFQVARSPGLDLSYIAFNMRDPVLADWRVRHAIGYAIDREAIVHHLRRGLGRVAVGLIPPESWAFEPDVHRFTLDRERARRLLDEAGYRDPDGDGPAPRLRLSMKISSSEEWRLQATVVQQDLKQVGIELDLLVYEFATFYADVVRGRFQLYSMQWIGGALVDPDIMRRVFHSRQAPPGGFNRGHYSNPEVDRLIDLATRSADMNERRRYYARAQQLVAEDAPYIPIWNRINAVVAQPTLAGVRLNPIGDFQALKDVTKTPGR